MKLKKLLILAYCVIVATMGITLTGCNLNIKDIIDGFSNDTSAESTNTDYESSRDTDYGSSRDTDCESSRDTDYGSSTDTNTEKPKTGTWVQTEMKYYAYKNGEEKYGEEGFARYRCYYRGVTEDNFVKFQTSGGYTSPTNPDDNSYIDTYHLCSVPETSYTAGGLVMLQVRTYWENYVNDWYPSGSAYVGLAYENKEADMTSDDPYKRDPFLHNISIGFYSALNDDYTTIVYENTSDTLTANMPEEAENGDRIAILFMPLTATGYGEYDVGSWVEWIYTYTENA